MENLCCYPPIDPDQRHPWLMVSHGKKLRNHTFYSISRNQYFERSIPNFCNMQVSQTNFSEWLALFDFNIRTFHCCLFNTTSKEKIQLPSFESDLTSYNCILSKPPSDPDCHVLLVSSSILFCRLGDDKFIRRTRTFEDGHLMAAVNFCGKIYGWIIRSHAYCSLVEVNFVGQDLVLRNFGQYYQIPNPSPLGYPLFGSYLVESCGELLMVHMIIFPCKQKVAYFRIFKVNFSEMKIEELSCIGDRTIFLCPHGSMSTLCGEGTYKKNSIYYLESLESDRNLYVYNIEDESKTLLRPAPIRRNTLYFMSWVTI
ncbi:hypothetical protein BUALT_Bualt13G0114000 [Buddleja alternifolia]|uniref:KIB1-4 beta-propeller domain-containing protein n=1 Tax=Buddleja alternifolia TaxID=168488 RepID=A0AAV6WXM7_9LAMI|nr:hypothetical protein BUALT_Bualt13G0114000 [Buddleja alternifolia]